MNNQFDGLATGLITICISWWWRKRGRISVTRVMGTELLAFIVGEYLLPYI
eukprot:gene14763-3418_t